MQPGPPPLPPETVGPRTWIAVCAAMLGAFMAVLDIQITNASLKEILGTLSATTEEGSWISSAYLVSEIVVIPIAGFLATVFGVRRYLMANVLLFLGASTLCGTARSLEAMIAFRALQGCSGGVMIPMAMMLVMRLLPLSRRPVGLALFGMTATLAPTLGPTVGGHLTELYGWPVIFYINWVPGLLLLAGVGWGLDREPMQLGLLRRVDWAGIGAMALGLASLTAMLEEGNAKDWFDSGFIQGTAALAVAGLCVWIWRSLTRSNSAVDLRVMARPSFLIAAVVTFTTGLGLYGSAFLLPLFLGQIAGYTPGQIGAVILWMGLPQVIVMPLAARLSTRIDNRLLATVGLLLFAGSCFMNIGMTAQTGADQLIAAQIVRALGQPLVMMTLNNFATAGIPPAQMGSSSGLFSMMRNLGGSVGIATLASMITWREHLHSARIGEGISLYDPATVQRLDALTQQLQGSPLGPVGAADAAVRLLDATVRREAFVMAYNDAFLVLGVGLMACIPVLWLSRRIVGGAAAAPRSAATARPAAPTAAPEA